MTFHTVVIIIKENKKLQAVNVREKQKRAKKCKYIATEEILTDAEDLARAQTTTEASTSHTKEIESVKSQSKKRASAQCSICRKFNHIAHSCPQRDEINSSN